MRTGYYYYYGGYPDYRTTDGFWWSGTSYFAASGRNLRTFTSGVAPQNNYGRGSGLAIRCTIRVE